MQLLSGSPISIAQHTPILRWLPSKLAEWIADYLGTELRIPAKKEAKWTAGELNQILANKIVPNRDGGHLNTFTTLQWECKHYNGRPKARCYPFDLNAIMQHNGVPMFYDTASSPNLTTRYICCSKNVKGRPFRVPLRQCFMGSNRTPTLPHRFSGRQGAVADSSKGAGNRSRLYELNSLMWRYGRGAAAQGYCRRG